jgi:glycosyltransferase involved in cell wall biosynthesis
MASITTLVTDIEECSTEVSAPCELTILMPCLNEAETVARCVAKARAYLARSGVNGEVVIADNGSTDGSQLIGARSGARVVVVPVRGYGSALLSGIRSARGRYVIMGDSDDSYDFGHLDDFVAKLREGYHLVMGNRFRGGIKPGAMPVLHRFLGNPVLTAVGRLFFRSPCGDFHCGLRGFDRDAILGLDLQAPGMEFASEMVVKASIFGLSITEVPTILYPDGRSRPPHLRRWRDGWRHLRFLLLFSPKWLFLYPGFALFAAGLMAMAWLLPGPRTIHGVSLDIHSLLYASLAVTTGFQSMQFWTFAKVYRTREGIAPWDAKFASVISLATLEVGLITGSVLSLLGLGLGVYAVASWDMVGLGALRPTETMRLVIPSATSVLLGFQVIYGAFFLSILEIRSPHPILYSITEKRK